MHEYPATKRIFEIACELAERHGIRRVQAINLVVGDDAGYAGDAIRLYFELLAEHSRCAGARLNIRRIRAKLRCPSCGRLFVRKPFSFECPRCGSTGTPTEIGKEFYIESLDYADEDASAEDSPRIERND
jgi:hydrogenase nickel incorporation protein HypA/HybF